MGTSRYARLAALLLTGCSLAPPYHPLRVQSDAQLRHDYQDCFDQTRPSPGKTAAILLGGPMIGGMIDNPGERINAQRLCMRDRGYCPTYAGSGFWSRDASGNFTWNEPTAPCEK